MNELKQEAEQALEFRDRQAAQWSPRQPPKDSLIPQRQAIRDILSEGGPSQVVQGPQGHMSPVPKREQKEEEQRAAPKSPLLPDRESQNEERRSAIDVVKQITGANQETSMSGVISIGDWDMRYDGIRGFPSLRGLTSN